MLKMRKYWALFCLTFIQGAKNIKMLIGLSIFLITCLVIFSHLWKVAVIHTEKAYFDPVLFLWYIALNEWVLVGIPDIYREMQQELQSGSLAYSVIRPISYLGSKFAEGFAHLVLQLLFLGIVTFTFTYLWTMTLPFGLVEGVVALAFGLLAGSLGLIFQMLVGLSCFWMQDATPFNWVFEKLLFVFGGLILPLVCYPEWMQTIAQFTPFPAILGGRSALVLDFSMSQVIYVFTSLVAWLALSALLVTFVFRRGMKILNVQGG